jgi:hypothetical protein
MQTLNEQVRQTNAQSKQCFIITDDERLAKKGARLFTDERAGEALFLAIAENEEEGDNQERTAQRLIRRISLAEAHSVLLTAFSAAADRAQAENQAENQTGAQNAERALFVDLDAKTFNPFETARFFRDNDALSGVRVIGFAVALDPHLTQRAKLHGVRDVLQRFIFEKLLRELSEMQ